MICSIAHPSSCHNILLRSMVGGRTEHVFHCILDMEQRWLKSIARAVEELSIANI